MKSNKSNNLSLRNILVFGFFLIFLLAYRLNAQQQIEHVGSILINKAFSFVTYLENSPGVTKIIRGHSDLKKLSLQHKKRIELALRQCEDVSCYAKAVMWTPDETALILDRLAQMSGENNEFKAMISKLRASGHYNVYASSPDAEFVKALWNSVSGGITRILDVYIKGENPFYAAIDSISFPADDRNFLADVKNMLADELRDMDGKAFYEVPVNVSISALLMNQRDEAARYEPLDKGINKTAIEGIKHVNWDNYQYSVILVPGQGPEKDGVSIDPQSIVRCELASDYYRAGAAPFMVVSGGHVHPNKTPFCEAIEMKKYMTGKLNIPEHVIFVEPHARHTTTNMRNTARMIYRFNMPDDKKILIVTDPVQNTYIDMMENRFMTELGCVPYRDLKKLTANTSEYFPDRNALQCNPMDPLDP